MEAIALILFLSVLIWILLGYRVAFALGGVSFLIGWAVLGLDFFELLPLRYMGIISNSVLIAVPLFVFMGVMYEKSGLAGSLLENMSRIIGVKSGGLAISTVIVGTLLAASTGIVGATVVTMGMISLPTMIRHNYAPGFAGGTIAASGTLGQVIPPSIVLILLGSVLNVSVGQLFKAAIIPGGLLIICYLFYVIVYSKMNPEQTGGVKDPAENEHKISFKEWMLTLGMPLILIIAVLGSIFAGIASPTEAAAIGAAAATLLAAISGKCNWKTIWETAKESTELTSMVFFILLGATTFALVFRGLEGDVYISNAIAGAGLGPTHFLILVMVIVFILGFFIDFLEIIFIIVPVVAPIFKEMGYDMIWLGILFALNLQTSFLTPPFGFSLFYLKGVAPPEMKTSQLYRGVIPFLLIQILLLISVIFFPDMIFLIFR